jgi:origin recognition complex subunit 2
MTIAEWQLDDPGAPGITFAHLFRMVRERFIMSSEQALLTQLTEFRDHELIKVRAGPDGGEVMYIPLSEESLQQMLEELKNISATQAKDGAGGAK